jgi:serine protease inhibitor
VTGTWTRAVTLLGLAVITVAGAGCGASPDAGPGGAGLEQADPSTRSAPPPADDSPATLTEGLAGFAHDFYLQAATPGKNVVVSPLSVAMAVSMARVGAGGETAAQIDRALHFPTTGRDAAFHRLATELGTDAPVPSPARDATRARDPEDPPQPPIVSTANGLFVQEGFSIGEAFRRTLATDYGAQSRTVDFTRDATDVIDAWVREQTAGRIDRLFDDLDPWTVLVLANAVYLKADWATAFIEEPTVDAAFHRSDGTVMTAPMMHRTGAMRYASGPGWQAVELPYAGDELAMRVVVPTGDAPLSDLLSPDAQAAVAVGLHEERVAFSMPRWDFATDLDLEPVLEGLGMTDAFTPAADFSGISPGLLIDQAIHRATITVTEWGTEAAAATGIAFRFSAQVPPPLEVRADHPFVFSVVHVPTGAPLFVGSVADPTAG